MSIYPKYGTDKAPWEVPVFDDRKRSAMEEYHRSKNKEHEYRMNVERERQMRNIYGMDFVDSVSTAKSNTAINTGPMMAHPGGLVAVERDAPEKDKQLNKLLLLTTNGGLKCS